MIYYLLLIASCFHCGAVNDFRKNYPDFIVSLHRNNKSYSAYNKYYGKNFLAFFQGDQRTRIRVLKDLYNRDRYKSFQNRDDYKIPRIIHQIWLGGSIPDKFLAYVKSWQDWEGWEYRLWTEEDLPELNLINSKLFEEASFYCEKADIMRYEILYRFGGLYVDTDFECLNPEFFEFAFLEYSFFAGLEPLEHHPLRIGNAIIASSPNHPLLAKLIADLPGNSSKNMHQGVVERTGPDLLTQEITNNINLLRVDGIIFPPTFFYPITAYETKDPIRFYRPETAAVHFWNTSNS